MAHLESLLSPTPLETSRHDNAMLQLHNGIAVSCMYVLLFNERGPL